MRFLWFVFWVIFNHVLKVRGWEGIGFHHPLTLYTPKDVGISPGSCERCSKLSYQHLEKNRGAVLDTLNKGWVNWHPWNRNHVRHHDLKVLGSIYIYIYISSIYSKICWFSCRQASMLVKIANEQCLGFWESDPKRCLTQGDGHSCFFHTMLV